MSQIPPSVVRQMYCPPGVSLSKQEAYARELASKGYTVKLHTHSRNQSVCDPTCSELTPEGVSK